MIKLNVMARFSIYPTGIKNITSLDSTNIFKVYSLIKNDEFLKQKTIMLRNLPSEELKNKYKCEALQYVTFGGIFSQRKDEKLEKKSDLVCLDLDGLENAINLKKQIVESNTLPVLLFISPKGNGLKLVFRCNPNFSYKDNYKTYSNFISSKFNLPKGIIDESCASISKACFLCHDNEVYISPHLKDNEVSGMDEIPYLGSELFILESKKQEVQITKGNEVQETSPLFESPSFQYFPIKLNYEKRESIESFKALCRICNKNNGNFEEGNRHNWVVALATFCNKFGMKKSTALDHFKSLFYDTQPIKNPNRSFDEKNDLIRPFTDIYEKNVADFGSWEKDDFDWENPTLPDKIFSELPEFISKLVNQFPIQKERDTFFLGLLTLLSSCFPKMQGLYDQKLCRMNLFVFVSAPPASGKGVLSFVRKIGEDIQQSFLDKYNDEMAEYRALPEEEKKEQPIPELKKLFVPANNTSAKMIKTISTNEVFGIINDTEADTITNANKAEHGHFTELLRKAFHHEAIEYDRKTNNEYITINDPSLSVLISGTPRQVNYLVNGLENGLASRFIYYSYTCKSGFKNVFENGPDLTYIFKSAASELYTMCKPYFHDYLESRNEEEIFSFTESQEKRFLDFFSLKHEYLEHIYGVDIRGSINRLGLIFFRIAMILTTIRVIGSPANTQLIKANFKCSDIDYNITTEIVEVLIHHTVAIFNQLKKNGGSKKHRNIKQDFFDKLPEEFNRNIAMEIAVLMQVKEKTAENYLSNYIKHNMMEKPAHNHYKKA